MIVLFVGRDMNDNPLNLCLIFQGLVASNGK